MENSKKKQSKEFSLGDVVQITSGFYSGRTGKLTKREIVKVETNEKGEPTSVNLYYCVLDNHDVVKVVENEISQI